MCACVCARAAHRHLPPQEFAGGARASSNQGLRTNANTWMGKRSGARAPCFCAQSFDAPLLRARSLGAPLPHMLRGCPAGADGLPTPNYAAYGATKAGILQLTRTLEEEAEDAGAHVHMLSPGGCTRTHAPNSRHATMPLVVAKEGV